MHVGSDHDMVLQRVDVLCPASRTDGRPNTRPNRVQGDIVIPEILNQEVLQNLAKKVAALYGKASYVDPPHVRACFQVAQESRQPEAWRKALRERSKARAEWSVERVEDAAQGNWQAYRVCQEGNGRLGIALCQQDD